MANCKECKKEIKWINKTTDFSGNDFCSLKCKKQFHDKIKNKANKEKELIKSGMIKEIKCTCNECGHIWHYLDSDVQRLRSQAFGNTMVGAGMCCNPFGTLFINKSLDISRELEKFSKCPKCNTSNITKEEKFYEKKT